MSRIAVRFDCSPAIGVVEVGIKVPEENGEFVFFAELRGRGEIVEREIRKTLTDVEGLGLGSNVYGFVCHHLDQARAHQREWDKRGRNQKGDQYGSG